MSSTAPRTETLTRDRRYWAIETPELYADWDAAVALLKARRIDYTVNDWTLLVGGEWLTATQVLDRLDPLPAPAYDDHDLADDPDEFPTPCGHPEIVPCWDCDPEFMRWKSARDDRQWEASR